MKLPIIPDDEVGTSRIDDGGRVADEQGHVSHELVLAGEGGPAGTLPLEVAAVLLVRPQVRQHRELLPVASLAHVHLRAVASLVMILHADHRLQRREPRVLLVPPAPFLRARVLLRRPTPATSAAAALHGVAQGGAGLVLVAVRPHVHPQIGVALEPFAAHLAVVGVLGQQIRRVQLDDVVVLRRRLPAAVSFGLARQRRQLTIVLWVDILIFIINITSVVVMIVISTRVAVVVISVNTRILTVPVMIDRVVMSGEERGGTALRRHNLVVLRHLLTSKHHGGCGDDDFLN